MTRRIDVAGLVIALILLAIAGAIWWDMTALQISSVYGVGPKAMPIVVAGGLALLAIGNLIMALRGDLPARDSLDWRPIILILGGLAALIALIAIGGGFIIGDRHPVRRHLGGLRTPGLPGRSRHRRRHRASSSTCFSPSSSPCPCRQGRSNV